MDKKQARVLYDYDAADNSELNLLADEVAGFHLFYGDCVSAIFIIVVFLTSCVKVYVLKRTATLKANAYVMQALIKPCNMPQT